MNNEKRNNPQVRKGGPPNVAMMMAGEKPKNIKKTFKRLFKYISEFKILILIAIIFTIGSTVFAIVSPKILGSATTEIFKGVVSKVSGKSGVDFTKVGKILLIVGALYLVSAIFSYIQGLIMVNVAQKITYRFRKEMIAKVNKMPFSYFDKRTYGETLSIITNDTENFNNGLNQSATQLISSVATIIGVFIMMLSINVVMTLVTLLSIPLSIMIISFIVKKSQKYYTGQQEHLASVNGKVEEMFSGQNVIKIFNNEDRMITNFETSNDKLYETGWKSQFLSSLMPPLMGFVGNINYVAIAVLGGYYATKGKITIGNIQSFIQYSKNFTQPINQIAQVSNMLQSMMASTERIFDFLDSEEEEQFKITENIDSIKGNVEFKHVKFSYEKDKEIIHDFSAKIKQGQKIAIVGPTGAGKTTIVKLLMRLYNVNDGEILIDGNDIKHYDRSKLRGVFGMVLQDTWLFSGTIMDNIKYGKQDATYDEVVKATKAANVHHFITTLPEGYDMYLNEDSNNISLGQKQLLTIARAILANPKVLILDEATSSVDTRTELLIQKAMDTLMKGRTSFIIAHRLSTIKNADLILVMNDGDIVEQGNHEQLLNKNGVYASLYNSQFS